MSRTARWFKGLFRIKKTNIRKSRVSGGDNSGDSNLLTDSVSLETFLMDALKEQDKHTIVVATATATTAEVAISAAKAATALVRLASAGRAGDIITTEELLASVKIQKVFRGSLARKALRALKGIVKLQALVRGYLVRKRAAETLQRIKALIRVQTTMRSKRINCCLNKEYNNTFQPRRSIVMNQDDGRSPKIVEMDDSYKRRSSSRSKSKPVQNVVAMSEYEDDMNDLELNFLDEKLKFNTPRFSSSSPHHHTAYSRYYVTESPSRNALCDYGSCSSTPGYMEKTQSFKAKVRSHSAPRQRFEMKRLSLDEVMAFKSSVSGMTLQQQQPQRSSCSYDPF